MGACSSRGDLEDMETDIGDATTEAVATKQRRRLSVTALHVGDISGQAQCVEEPDENKAEVQAKDGIKVVAKTKKGIIPYNNDKVNQDRAIVAYALQDDPDISLFGVADGHGQFGHNVAAFVQEKLPVYLSKQKNLKTDTAEAMIVGVKQMCAELSKTKIDCSFSGTTLVFGVKVGSKIFIGNIGDSRCALGRNDGKGGVVGIALSEDQKPENPEENKRILAAGGRVHPLPGPPDEDNGPERVWLAQVDVPGLAMSRSIGDTVAQTVGVISVPEVKVHEFKADDSFLIWASDGVWEFIDNQEACNLVHKHIDDLSKAAVKLVALSSKKWRQEDQVIDDITCVILQLTRSHQA